MSDVQQNPHRCTDNGCIFAVRSAPRGMGTNGGCRCLDEVPDHETRMRLRRAINWLRDRVDELERARLKP